MHKNSFLVLIIYIIVSLKGFCQNLKLEIDGKTEAQTNTIDSLGYLKVHPDYASLKSEIDTFQNSLYNIGYIESEIIEIKKLNDSTFHAQFNLNKKFTSLYVNYNHNTIDINILKLFSNKVFENYFILDFSQIENALNILNSEISNKGFPFSKLKLTNIIQRDSENLEANLIVDTPERNRIINNIIIKGYTNFPKSYLKHYLKIKPKQVFDLKEAQKKTSQLNDLHFASEIKSPEVLFTKDSTTLYIYLKKLKSNTFDGFLGFGTNDKTSKLEFDGYLNLNLTNNLNFGESFKLLYKSDENDQKTFQTNISLPYLFKTPIGADLQLRIFKRDSSFTTVNQSARLHYQINSKNKIFAGIVSTESNNLLKENTSLIISDYKKQQFTFAYQFINPQTNNLLSPIRSKLYFETTIGKRKNDNNSEKQSQFSLDALKIFKLNAKNSLYIRINGSNLISDTYFENELLRFGGINSIRGFEENSIYATLYGITNTEYRYKLNNSIYIHSIIDAGYFENKILNTKEKLFGYGFGFGILTNSGLLRFNYANGKNENTQFKLSNSKIHLSLTANF